MSFHIENKTAIKTSSFIFPEAPELFKPEPQEEPDQVEQARQERPLASADFSESTTSSPLPQEDLLKKIAQRQTRLRPPTDVVKLEDRLYYVLQPTLENLFSGSSLEFPFTPFPYQFEGIAFLYPSHGAILADEMGLGKTMQAISAIRMLLNSGELKQILLICPKPLVTNWKREFQLWAPEIPIAIIEGDQTRRHWQWQEAQAPVKIANYELLMRDWPHLEDEGLHFDLVVLDEAQRIKNKNSTTSQLVRNLPRTRSWALTGTPIENSTKDLIGIFEYLAPGEINENMPLAEISKTARQHTLRRTKDLVLTDLPPRMNRDANVTLSPEQQTSYEMAEKEGIIHLNELGNSITVQHVFELVLRLKQICNADPRTGTSSKLERLEADLEEVAASGKKAIIFSQWVQTLDILKERLTHFSPLCYHGRVPSKKRDSILTRFKEDPKHSLILMSYGAGAVGLNLQFCEYVFLYDRWWNPAVEDQAINRAHRIGAAGPVTVTRFVSLDTIEERIDQILREKRELFNRVFEEGDMPTNVGLSQDEIFGLFDLRTPQGPISKAA
ncbi:MAG: DEAD/DEAH box helicase [Pirellulaceae bacterium]|nr:DEAD/DEAH box helicase [Pirellulaceae bacterium]